VKVGMCYKLTTGYSGLAIGYRQHGIVTKSHFHITEKADIVIKMKYKYLI